MKSCRIVLVRTEIPGNIGSVARLIRNFGAGELVLVNPACDHLSEAAQSLAASAVDVLHNARVLTDLPSALADCVTTVATSSLTGGLYRRQSVRNPTETAGQLVRDLASGPVAVVFGPEPVGLSNEEVRLCHSLMHIPTDPGYAALNLSHAVAVCLYELHRAWLVRVPSAAVDIATHGELERALGELETGLNAIGYLRGSRGPALWHAIRHLLGRAQPSSMESGLLLGLGRQLQWLARQNSNESQTQ